MKQETENKLQALMGGIGESIGYLYYRWQDEKGYENIEDYGKSLQKTVDKLNLGVTITFMSSQPFGFTFDMDGISFKLSCKVEGNGLRMSIKYA